jgi:hypothetical protein
MLPMRRPIITLIAMAGAIAIGAISVACSSSTSSGGSSGTTAEGGSSGGPVEGGTTADSSTDGGSGTDAADAGPVNNCKTFDDRTAAGATRTITWGFAIPAADRCIDIKVGQSVTWNGDFTMYRVGASGGDKPNPIAGFDPATPTVKFPAAGTFGFESPDAPALIGAIRVNP